MRLVLEIRVLTAVAALLAAVALAVGLAGAAAGGQRHPAAAAAQTTGAEDPGTWGWG